MNVGRVALVARRELPSLVLSPLTALVPRTRTPCYARPPLIPAPLSRHLSGTCDPHENPGDELFIRVGSFPVP